ncbi:HicB family protein [Escherichia coli]|nr:HicB family protein [Escherichia coli]
MIKLKTPNSMEIAGQPAVITYVPELNAFRGKFLGLSGYCDFVSDSIQGCKKKGNFPCESILRIVKLRVLSRMRVQKRLRPLRYAIQNR